MFNIRRGGGVRVPVKTESVSMGKRKASAEAFHENATVVEIPAKTNEQTKNVEVGKREE